MICNLNELNLVLFWKQWCKEFTHRDLHIISFNHGFKRFKGRVKRGHGQKKGREDANCEQVFTLLAKLKIPQIKRTDINVNGTHRGPKQPKM